MWYFKYGLVFLLLFLFSCGYQVGVTRQFPGKAQKIAILPFKNETYEAAIEDAFTEALKYEFLKSRHVQLVSVKEADAVIYGTIHSFTLSVAGTKEKTFTPGRQLKLLATAYTATASVSIAIKDKKTGKVLWEKSLTNPESYGAGEDSLVNETNQRTAISELAQYMMEDIHDQIFMDF